MEMKSSICYNIFPTMSVKKALNLKKRRERGGPTANPSPERMWKTVRILVSACLLGVLCRYDGGSQPCEKVISLMKEHELIPVCPEQLGGLQTPRLPSEIRGDKVVASNETDVTAQFERGAQEALKIARLYGCEEAILKSDSPSCGHGRVYDGTFTGSKCPGDGVTCRRLMEAGIRVRSEKEI